MPRRIKSFTPSPPVAKPIEVKKEKIGFNREEAIERRYDRMAEFLVSNPEVAQVYEKAIMANDRAARDELDSAIVSRLNEIDPDYGMFETAPKVTRFLPPKERKGRQKGKGWDRVRQDRIEVTEPKQAPLYPPHIEDVYNYIDEGLLDISAKKGTENYIEDGIVNVYAGMVRERTPEYAKHKHYGKIRQRIGEQLAVEDLGFFGMGGILSEQLSELVSSAIPFRDELIEKIVPEEELNRRRRISSLMDLADESTQNFQLIGKIAGLLTTGGLGYASLSRHGLTKMLGVGNAQKVKTILATSGAEVGLDLAYNHHGATFILGGLLDDDQNRILSGVEAIAMGGAFNLGIDAMRALKGKKLREAILEMEKLAPQHASLIQTLRARVAQGTSHRADLVQTLKARVAQETSPASARYLVKQPPIPVDVPQAKPISPIRPDQADMEDVLVAGSAVRRLTRLDELDKLIEQGTLKLSGEVPPKDVSLVRRKLKENKQAAEAIRRDISAADPHEWASVEAQMRINQVADNAMKQSLLDDAQVGAKLQEESGKAAAKAGVPHTAKGQWFSDANAARKLDLPERNLIDYDDWAASSAELQAMRPRERGWSRLAARDGVLHGMAAPLGISLIGGGLSMSQSDEDKVGAFLAGAMLPIAPRNSLQRFARAFREGGNLSYFGKAASYFAEPFRSSIMRMSPRIGWDVLRHRMRTMFEASKKLETAAVFLDHMNRMVHKNIISLKDKEMIYNALDTGERSKAIRAFEVIDSHLPQAQKGNTIAFFNAFEKVIRNTWTEADRVGLEMGFIKDYFSRSISPKMYKQFLKDKNIKNDSRIQKAWDEAQIEARDHTLTDYEKTQIANSVITKMQTTKGGGLSSAKERKLSYVSEDMRKYYDSFEEAQIKYIGQTTDAINLHKWLGVGLTKNKLQYDPAKVKEIKKRIKKEYKYGASDGISKTEYKKLVAQETSKLDKVRLPKHFGKYDYRETIGNKVREVVEAGGLAPKHIDRMTHLLHKRYSTPTGIPAPEWMKQMRDVGYMLTIGNPYSTITQFSDLMLGASLGSRGMGDTVFAQAAKKLSGKNMDFLLSDFMIDPTGLQRLLVELGDEAATTKALRINLKLTGFSAVDVFGKETLLNATFAELKKAARAAPNKRAHKRLFEEYGEALGEEFDGFVQALREGNKNNDNVRAAVFQRLADQHPITLDEMPMFYIKHPMGRTLYALKSFTIKQMDLLRKRTLDQIAKGVETNNVGMILDGMKDSLKYAIMFGGGTMGINQLKDWILGREVEFSDQAVGAAMQLFGLSRFHIERTRRIIKSNKSSEEMLKIGGGLLPPALTILMDSVGPDIIDMATGDLKRTTSRGKKLSIMGIPTPIRDKHIPFVKARSWRYSPLGKDMFWTIGLGLDWEKNRRSKGRSSGRSSSRSSSRGSSRRSSGRSKRNR